MRTIKYKVSYEKMISRLPALFAFLETDEQGTCEIVKATKGEQGDYGKIIANVIIPEGCGFYYKCKDGETVLKITEGSEKTYRTIISTYYKALSDKSWEREYDEDINSYVYKDKFLAFVERGIGLRYVGLTKGDGGDTSCGINDKVTYPLAPDYIYLGEANSLLEKIINLRNQVKFYEEHTKMCKDDKPYYQRCKEEYEARNGDKLIETLYKLIDEADTIAEEYIGYTTDTNGLSLDFNVNLVNTIKDLGTVTPYIQEWVAGERYYNGDVVYYVDDNGYGMTWECTLGDGAQTDDLGRKYTEGTYNENTEDITFDSDNWKAQSLNWVKRNKHLICPKCGRLYEVENEEIKPTSCECGYQFTDEDKLHSYASLMTDTVTIEGTAMSQLSSLRRFETYTNKNDEAEYPLAGTDWLWYYRIGTVTNREEKYDELGNLGVMYDEGDIVGKGVEPITNDGETIGSNIVWDGEYATNLSAWGDVLTNITAENDNSNRQGTITFEYVLGAHLKAKKSELIQVSEDFSIGGTSYKKDEIISYSTYSKDKNNFDGVTFKAKNEFVYGGDEHKEEDTLTLDEYNMLNEEWYEVTEEFIPDRKTYDVGTELSKELFDNLVIIFENSFDTDYNIIKSFVIGGNIYNEGQHVSADEYKELRILFKKCFDSEYKVTRKFAVGGKKYEVGSFIEKTDYEQLTDEFKKKCISNKNKVMFTFTGKAVMSSNLYSSGDTVSRETYEALTTENQNNCKIIVIEKFWSGDSVWDENNYCYNVGEEIAYGTYSKLSDGKKDKVTFLVMNTFSVVSYYEEGNSIFKDEFDSLPSGTKGTPSLFTITVMETFVDGKTRCKKGDEISEDDFKKIEEKETSLLDNIAIVLNKNVTITEEGKSVREYYKDDYITNETYNSLPEEYQAKCKKTDEKWYSTDDDGNYKYYFSDFKMDSDSRYGKNMGVKYTESYIYYKGGETFVITEDFLNTYTKKYNVGDELSEKEYESLSEANKNNCEVGDEIIVVTSFSVTIENTYYEGEVIDNDVYYTITPNNKNKCRRTDETIWTLVEDGLFDKYVNGEFDKGAIPSAVEDDENYYKLYDKMEFSYETTNYKLKVGSRFKDVQYIKSNFEATADITHVDIEERPLIRYDYYNGVSFQPTLNDEVNIERGVTQAFEKHIKLGEIKTFEDFENYSNGGYFVISKESIDLG